jgi:integrase
MLLMAAAPKMVPTKTPGVYRRGSKYVVTFRDADGRQRKESYRTYDLARAKKREREREVEAGEYAPASRILFHDYATEWVESYGGRKRGIRERTRRDYARDLERYAFRYFPKGKRLASVGPRDVDLFIAWLLDAKQHDRPLTPRSAERILVPVKLCFKSARRYGLIPSDPTTDAVVPYPDKIEEDDEAVKAMTRKQLRRFIACIKEPTWRLFFETLACTGARWSEANAWQVKDLDTKVGCLRVRRSLYEGEQQPPKTKHSRRDIPLPRGLVERLARHAEGKSPDTYIFAARNEAPLRYENVRARQLLPAAEKAGVPWVRFHTFRHTAATLLFAEGKNVVQVQRFLGHHSPAFTLDTYVHLLDNDLGKGLSLNLDH